MRAHRDGFVDLADLSVNVGTTPLVGRQRQLVERLGGAIAAGELVPGEQISPDELAASHHVSRTVVREALKVLETKGMVSARPRAGTRINAVARWRLLDPDVIRWRSAGPDSARQISELLAIRGAIEPLAAREASSHATSAQVNELNVCLREMAAAVAAQDWERFTETDVAFHQTLLEASGNQIMGQFLEPIEAALRVRHRLHLIPNRLGDGVVDSHTRIVAAITARDAVAAEQASRSIVDVAGVETMASLGHAPSGSSGR